MSLWRANLTVGPFRQGEIVDIDESEFASYIEKGWLRKFDEGLLYSTLVVPSEAAHSETAEPAGDASPATPQPGDAAPPVPTSFEAHAVDDDLALGDR